MSRRPEIKVVEHISGEELSRRIRGLEKDVRVLNRLHFIQYLYSGFSVEEACGKVGIVKAVGYEWVRRWNSEGLNGLVPRFGGGRPSKLSVDQKASLVYLLVQRDDWTLEEIRDLVRDNYGVEYNVSQVSRILHSLDMNCGKPYPRDYRMPANASEILKKPRRAGVVSGGMGGRVSGRIQSSDHEQ